MRCKRHPCELGVGVCASCLRERLLALIASQNGRSPELRRDLDPPLPPASFPRSVSPYVCHRRSLGSGPSPSSHLRPHCRFFSTPQVGPAANSERIDAYRSYSCNNDSNISGGSGKKSKKFSLFSALFGIPRSDDVRSSSKSSSWISGLFPGRRKKKPHRQSRSKSFQDRGMSPVRDNDDDDNDSACSSGYSTESSTGWRRPEPTPVRKFTSSSSSAAARHGRGVSGFAVCLSPLVRPRSKAAADLGISGDLRGALSGHHHNHRHHHNHQHHHQQQQHQHRRHVSAGAGSLVPNRSRKLADHGRFR